MSSKLILTLLVIVGFCCFFSSQQVEALKLRDTVKKIKNSIKSVAKTVKSLANSDKEMESLNRSLKTICPRDVEWAGFFSQDVYENKISQYPIVKCSSLPNAKEYQVIKFHRSSQTSFKVYYNSLRKILVISFRGVEPKNVKNWVDSFNVKLVDFNGNGKVHRGFLQHYKKLKETLVQALKKVFTENQVETVMFTGHSKGGAVTSMAALDFVSSKYIDYKNAKIKLITFGQPRVGNSKFVETINSLIPEYARVVDFYKSKKNKTRFDLVTIVPPRALHFSHGGVDIRIKCEKKNRVKCHEIKQYNKAIQML